MKGASIINFHLILESLKYLNTLVMPQHVHLMPQADVKCTKVQQNNIFMVAILETTRNNS